METHYEKWWASLTVAQKERIARKIVEKDGKEADVTYPHCTAIWLEISEQRKAAIYRHCTDEHGMLLEEWQEGRSFSY